MISSPEQVDREGICLVLTHSSRVLHTLQEKSRFLIVARFQMFMVNKYEVTQLVKLYLVSLVYAEWFYQGRELAPTNVKRGFVNRWFIGMAKVWYRWKGKGTARQSPLQVF